MSDFDFAFKYVLGREGKYSNHPNDKGGPTKYGITQSTYARYKGRSVSPQEVQNMPLEDAHKIYFQRYWLPLCCDKINSTAKATAIFDQGVNRGIGWPPTVIQSICGVPEDGHIGTVTLAALNALSDFDFIASFERRAEAAYLSIVEHHPTQKVFLRGWINRAKRLLTLIKDKTINVFK